MDLRDYQTAFVEATLGKWSEFDRLLGVAPTGAGKTIIAAELVRRLRVKNDGRVLFLVDALELLKQAADKVATWSGEPVAIEQGGHRAQPGTGVVVATSQSIGRRLERWPEDGFTHIIIDEAHRNTLGTYPKRVLEHFGEAKVLGITATPFRADKRQLSEFYEDVCYEISLPSLIEQGHLSRIEVRSVPCGVDLSAVRTQAGDYRAGDLGEAVDPHLDALASLLAEHAWDRKTVAFLPLIETSKAFAAACRANGLRAVHVDGTDREALQENWHVVCNAQLLSTGWDCPDVDCVYILRPTKSAVLYQQMVGRGTRTAEGKDNLLVLDPLWLSDDHRLVRPARLVATSDEEARSMEGRQGDLLEIQQEAEADRLEAIRKRLAASAKRKARTLGAAELGVVLDDAVLMEYEPVSPWESQKVTDRQLSALTRMGIDAESITCKGHASKILERLFARRENGLATVKQIKWLRKFGHPKASTCTFEDATGYLDEHFSKGRPQVAVSKN